MLEIEEPELRSTETMILTGPANLQRGVETVGGALFLSSERLLFRAHRGNVQKTPLDIDLQQIAGVTPCWTKFLAVLPIWPNSLAVGLENGKQWRFVLRHRDQWQQKIEAAIEAAIETRPSPA